MQPTLRTNLSETLQHADRYAPATPWGPVGAIIIIALAVLIQLGTLMALAATVRLSGALSDAEFTNFLDNIVSLKTLPGVAAAIAAQLAAVTVLWLAAGYRSARADVLRLNEPKPTWTAAILIGLAMALVIAPIELAIYYATGTDLLTDTRWIAEGLRQPTWWAVLIVAVVLAPLWEEMAFRGFLLSSLAKTRLGFWPAATLSTGIWTGLHAGYSAAGIASVFLAGMALSWLMLRTGSMRTVVVAHAVANAIACGVALALTM